jgi:predicted RNase H-like HicB family nuclease
MIADALKMWYSETARKERRILMKVKAVFAKDGDWWLAWTNNIPGAATMGGTLEEARENLMSLIAEMQKPSVPKREMIFEDIEI